VEGVTSNGHPYSDASPGERTQYHAISDVSFPSLEALQACASSQGGKEALAHAASISTGGHPVIMGVADDLAAG
jgi:hypothetical protein